MKANNIRDMVESILREIKTRSREGQSLLIAIDGRCAAGKTTLADGLQEASDCNVIHMDHFFPRPEQRTAERLNEPGGNVDYERFMAEVMAPLKRGEAFSYRPYDCRKQELADAIRIEPNPINIVEGAYCCRPVLFENYNLKIFLTVDEEEQLRRIRLRNGETCAVRFREKWIPMEERYFSAYSIKERCDLCFKTESESD